MHISLQGIADFAIGKFRVTSLRESVIDFSSPFMYEPEGMAMRRPHRGGNVRFVMFHNERDIPYYFSSANQQKAGTKI